MLNLQHIFPAIGTSSRLCSTQGGGVRGEAPQQINPARAMTRKLLAGDSHTPCLTAGNYLAGLALAGAFARAQ